MHVNKARIPSRNLRPVHPGDILKREFLEPLGLSGYRLARELGVSLPTVNDILRRRRAVTAETALRLARYFGTTPQLWQNLQAQFDLEVATAKIGRSVTREVRPHAGRIGPIQPRFLPDRSSNVALTGRVNEPSAAGWPRSRP